jgi:hypothetical protein
MNPAQACTPRPQRDTSDWINYVADSVANPDTMGQELFWLLFHFEGFFKTDAWCSPQTGDLTRATGWSENTLAKWLDVAEAEGWFERVFTKDANGHPTNRIGFVARRRLNPALAVATDETFDQVLEAMRDGLKRRRTKARTIPIAQATRASRPERGPQSLGGAAPKVWGARGPAHIGSARASLSFSKGSHLDKQEPPQRQRPDLPTKAVLPVKPPEPPPPAAAPGPAQVEELTPGQREFLAWLSPAARATFEALPQAKRFEALGWHRKGFDGCVARDQAAKWAPPPPSPPPPPPAATTEELIERIAEPGAPGSWIPRLADALARDLKDPKFCREHERIASLIFQGKLPPGDVCNAYRQAMKPTIVNRGAKFWKAVQGLTGLTAEKLKADVPRTTWAATASGRRC